MIRISEKRAKNLYNNDNIVIYCLPNKLKMDHNLKNAIELHKADFKDFEIAKSKTLKYLKKNNFTKVYGKSLSYYIHEYNSLCILRDYNL